MPHTKYLIHLDILGFETLAENVAAQAQVEARKVRRDFIDIIQDKINFLEKENLITGKKYGESDDWLLVSPSLDNVFRSLREILDHDTDYKVQRRVPLEVAIGSAEYDKRATLSGKYLVTEDPTLRCLKTDINRHYHESVKRLTNESPRSTFILLTDSVYNEIAPMDKKMCTRIDYKLDKGGTLVFFCADVDKVERRGKVLAFLAKLHLSGSNWYGRIDDIYVPPSGYDDIVKTLKENRIVFITGTQEYGKTYTAVRLLWEFYNDGYEPRWFFGGELAERTEVRRQLESIEVHLRPNHITYFEDPFGKTKYEKREHIEREIATIINSIKRVPDTYAIITSREEVFKDFQAEKLSTIDLRIFEKSLSIKKPSYDTEKRNEILLRWAEEQDCKWLDIDRLKNSVLMQMKRQETILPTPLSIKNFVVNTASADTEEVLLRELSKGSKETSEVFAQEIQNMTDDKILFLSFLFISREWNVGFLRTLYNESLSEFNIRAAWGFDRLLRWFIDDKVKLFNGKIGFSHPSYFESLESLLVERGFVSRINRDIFSQLLINLVRKGQAIVSVTGAILYYHSKLPPHVGDLIFTLFEKQEVLKVFAWRVGYRLYKLPDNVWGELLCVISERGHGEQVLPALGKELQKVSIDIRERLLLELCKNAAISGAIAHYLAENVELLSVDTMSKALTTLLEKNRACGGIATLLERKFDKVPQALRDKALLKLFEMGRSIGPLARIIGKHYHVLPEDIRNIFWKLSKTQRGGGDIARVIADNFDRFPIEPSCRLLIELSEADPNAGGVAWAVAKNFDRLPEELKNRLLFNLSKRERAGALVALIIERHFDRIPGDLRNRMIAQLSMKDKSAEAILRILAIHFDEVPNEIRNALFLNLSEKREAAEGAARALGRHFDKFPPETRDLLLIRLAEKSKAAYEVVRAIVRERGEKIPSRTKDRIRCQF
jgi:hypothetical protein